jgi:hypothetical protein
MANRKHGLENKNADTPDKHLGLEPPIHESSEQRAIAPGVYDKDRLMPVGKPGVRVKDNHDNEAS